jgi:hypothetical protein
VKHIAEILRRVADDIEHNAQSRPRLAEIHGDETTRDEAVVIYFGGANREWLIDRLRRES